MVVFSLVAGVDLTYAPLATLLAILFAAYFAFTLRRFAPSEQVGNTRWSDREREVLSTPGSYVSWREGSRNGACEQPGAGIRRRSAYKTRGDRRTGTSERPRRSKPCESLGSHRPPALVAGAPLGRTAASVIDASARRCSRRGRWRLYTRARWRGGHLRGPTGGRRGRSGGRSPRRRGARLSNGVRTRAQVDLSRGLSERLSKRR
jgi:hypothetical protein